jgi:Lon protease-like protein
MNGPQEPTDAPDLSSVPLFPLPGVVLFPRAVLPLHIFEERYKTMMADALRGERQIAMALLRPGWERDYHGKPAIDPVVCVGKILSHERLPDGKYNLLLQGQARARIVRENDSDTPYRLAELEALAETEASPADMDAERDRLSRLFRTAMLGGTRSTWPTSAGGSTGCSALGSSAARRWAGSSSSSWPARPAPPTWPTWSRSTTSRTWR